MSTATEKTSFKDILLRAVAVIGLVAVLLVGAWGIIQIAFYIPTLFGTSDEAPTAQTNTTSNISASAVAGAQTQAPESLAMTSPGLITSGQAFLLSWNHQNEVGNYAYEVSYSCADGLSLKALVPTGAYQTVACNTPFNFINASSSMPIILSVTGKKQAQTTLTVAAQRLSDGVITTLASSTTAVLPKLSASTPAAPVVTTAPTTPTVKPVSTKPALYGLADFSAQILSVTPSNIAYGQTHYTAQFVIQNIGSNATPANWAFDAIIPLNPAYTYHSPMQRALYPGDKIVYTLGFDIPLNNNQYFAQHQGAFIIVADPQNIAQENNESNNTASVLVGL